MRDDSKPWILGIASSHNGAACLLHGDEIVAAVQEERLLRRKRAQLPGARPSLAVRYCFDYAGISAADLSLIVLSTSGECSESINDLALNRQLRSAWHRVPTATIGHHMAHAIAAFATSGFSESAVLVVDGSGSTLPDMSPEERRVLNVRQLSGAAQPGRGPFMESISMYVASDRHVGPIEKQGFAEDLGPKRGMRRFGSLGDMYAKTASQIFGTGLDGAGKMMGLAPYGTPTTPPRDFYAIEDGQIDFLDIVPNRFLHKDRWPLRRQEYQDLAASAQRALEDALFVLVLRLRALSNARRLCYAGGVALNSVANELIIRESGFDDVYIMPAAEDSGTALGAAYYGLWQLTGRNTRRRLRHDAVGRQYTDAEVTTAIGRCPCIHVAETVNVIDHTVDALCDGKILGWFQGRSELGPRALGQRSIICDPRVPAVRDLLNRTIKFREEFRPFAPVLSHANLSACFEGTREDDDSPFMLRVLSFRQEMRNLVPAVVHVDGTGRVQTVTPDANGRFFDLLDCFYRRTGCPVLLNTSFNVAGEPIVETPDDALHCLLMTGLDGCVLENTLIMKDPSLRSPLDLVPRLTIEAVTLSCPLASLPQPPLSNGRVEMRFFSSARWDGAGIDRETKYDGDVVQMVIDTHWGPVRHVTNAEVIEVLKRVDGRRSGWELLYALRTDVQPDLSEREFGTILATLGRASILEWREPQRPDARQRQPSDVEAPRSQVMSIRH